jgi:recombinational DNA repair protein RecR
MPTVGEKLYVSFTKNEFPDIETMTAFNINSINKFTDLKSKKLNIKQLNNIAKVNKDYKECDNCRYTTITTQKYCENCMEIFK